MILYICKEKLCRDSSINEEFYLQNVLMIKTFELRVVLCCLQVGTDGGKRILLKTTLYATDEIPIFRFANKRLRYS